MLNPLCALLFELIKLRFIFLFNDFIMLNVLLIQVIHLFKLLKMLINLYAFKFILIT